MKSQLYASIGIMAGSYAHNIKNLLVRPNDLIARCMEAADGDREQHGMLEEVRTTLGTVTERLQQILRTVRRDPANAEVTQVDVNALFRDTLHTWAETGRDKWKLTVTADVPPGPASSPATCRTSSRRWRTWCSTPATRPSRCATTCATRPSETDATARRQKLLDAAAWKGEVYLSTAATATTSSSKCATTASG